MSEKRSIQVKQLNKILDRVVTPRLNRLLSDNYGTITINVSDDVEEDVEDETEDGDRIYVPKFTIIIIINSDEKLNYRLQYNIANILLNGAKYVLSNDFIIYLEFINGLGQYSDMNFYTTGETISDTDAIRNITQFL